HNLPPARRQHALAAALRGRAPRRREAPPADEGTRAEAPPRAARRRPVGPRPSRRRAARRAAGAAGGADAAPPPTLRPAARRRCRPDVVLVGGWNQPAFWQALLYARAARVPFVVWVESTARDERAGRGPAEAAKRAVVRGAAAFVVPGRAAAEYVRSLGAKQIAVAPNAVDLGVFGERTERRAELRAKLGLERVTFLCVSRLSREKGVDLLVRAFDGVPGELALVGDGPDRERVAALAGPRVRLLGRIERDELVDWYAAADAFVMPSRSET